MDAKKLAELIKGKKAAMKQRAKTVKPNPGSNRYVLLPGWRKGEEYTFFHDFGQHYIKNAADEIQAVYPCLDMTYGRPCPVCEGLNRAMKQTTDDETVELLKKAKSSRSYLMNVLALDSDDDAAPQILEVRQTVFGQIMALLEEWGGGVFDPEEPQIIVVTREGKGLNTKYSVQISPKKHKLPKGVLAKLHNLDEYVTQENEEQQRRALTAINSVAGLLSAPTPAAARASTAEDHENVAARNKAEASRSSSADLALDSELDDLLGDLTGTDD